MSFLLRLRNCPILDDKIVDLKKVAEQTIKYICEVVINQYSGIGVSCWVTMVAKGKPSYQGVG